MLLLLLLRLRGNRWPVVSRLALWREFRGKLARRLLLRELLLAALALSCVDGVV